MRVGERCEEVLDRARRERPGEDEALPAVTLLFLQVGELVVFLDALPRNPTGKVLKRELREISVGGDDEKS